MARPRKPKEPTSAQVREWENTNGRGHKAAAAHFRSQGFDVSVERIAELYRGGASSQSSAPRAVRIPSTKRAEPAAAPIRARTRTEDEPAPELPADRPEAGTRAWYEWRLGQVERELLTATGAPAAALERRALQYAEKIAELRRAEQADQPMTHDELVAMCAADAAELADPYLEPFVREFCTRHRLVLVRPPDHELAPADA
jgi:hypothetical protein